MAGESRNSAHERPDVLIVVNELLCFVMNKRRIMPDDSIIQLCNDFYDDGAVEEAKKVLFSHYADNDDPKDRCITRSGDLKRQRNLRDCLDLLTRKGKKDSVSFAAVDFSNMPSVSFDNIDVSALLLRMETMETEVSQMKRAIKVQESVTSSLHSVVQDSVTTSFRKEPLSEVWCHSDSGSNDGIAIENSTPTDRRAWNTVVKRKLKSSATPPVTPAPVQQPDLKKRPTATRNIVGRAKDVAIKAAKKRVRLANVFASRLDPDLQTHDLQSYLSSELSIPMGDITVDLVRRSDWHSSFHVRCNCMDPSVFMNCDIWPEDAYVRWWREPKANEPSPPHQQAAAPEEGSPDSDVTNLKQPAMNGTNASPT